MHDEPWLTPEDTRIWQQLQDAARRWSRTDAHKRRLDRAIEAANRMHVLHPRAYAAISGGKDSVCMAHMLYAVAIRPPLMNIHDELSFPDMIPYLTRFARSIGAKIEVTNWTGGIDIMRERYQLGTAFADTDFCSRSSGQVNSWFQYIDDYAADRGYPGVYLGIRKTESAGRLRHVCARGEIYDRGDGQSVCMPLAHWDGLDIYAYAVANNIELHPVYRCVRLHETPDRVRLNGWCPGHHARKGGMIWLRTYYPSLFRRLTTILEDAGRFA